MEGTFGDGQAIEGSEPLLDTAFNSYPRQEFTTDAQAESFQGFEFGGISDSDMQGFVLFAEGDAGMLLAPFGQEQFCQGEVWVEVVEVNRFQLSGFGQGFEQAFFAQQASIQQGGVQGPAFLSGLSRQGFEEGVVQPELGEGEEELIGHGDAAVGLLLGFFFRLDADDEGAHTFVVKGLLARIADGPPEAGEGEAEGEEGEEAAEQSSDNADGEAFFVDELEAKESTPWGSAIPSDGEEACISESEQGEQGEAGRPQYSPGGGAAKPRVIPHHGFGDPQDSPCSQAQEQGIGVEGCEQAPEGGGQGLMGFLKGVGVRGGWGRGLVFRVNKAGGGA